VPRLQDVIEKLLRIFNPAPEAFPQVRGRPAAAPGELGELVVAYGAQ